jgi:uncharacterized protein (TIGR03086 family)
MFIISEDLRRPDAAAVRATIDLVAAVSPADLDRPTPCADWDLRALLEHMGAQHRGFAAAAEGRGGDLTLWQPHPAISYAESAARVLAAFAPDDVLDRPFRLPEAGDRPVPARMAIGFHLVDYVVHGWDVAAAVGVRWELPAWVLEAALPIAEAVPDGLSRRQPGAAFGPAVATAGGAGALDRILTLLGRSPGWRPPTA